jgi:hypothetical protein
VFSFIKKQGSAGLVLESGLLKTQSSFLVLGSRIISLQCKVGTDDKKVLDLQSRAYNQGRRFEKMDSSIKIPRSVFCMSYHGMLIPELRAQAMGFGIPSLDVFSYNLELLL